MIHNKVYSNLYKYSQKHIPYKWIGWIGLKNLSREQIGNFIIRYGLSLIIGITALFINYLFRFYPDKTLLYMIFLSLSVLSAWYGGLNTGIFTTTIIALGIFFIPESLDRYYLPNVDLLIKLAIFVISSLIISFLIDPAGKTNEIKKLKRQQKEYAENFIKLHDDFSKTYEEVKTRDEFLSVVSHELKTPLTTMLLKLHNMLNSVHHVSLADFSVPELTNVLENAEKQIKRLTAMINDLLNVSLIRAGRMNLEVEDTDLVELTKQVTQNFAELLERGKYKISIDAKSPVVGSWDKLRIEQAITNLISNAIKYGQGKPIEIKISNNGDCGKFTIQDGGIGIARDEQKAIFGLFQRAAGSNDHQKGLGIGLYITSQIVKIHCGKISVSSAPMKGACFTINLPLNQKDKV